MRKFIGLLLATSLLVVTPTSAQAAKPKKRNRTPEQVFHKLDKNGDGALTLAELTGKRTGEKATKAEQIFKRLDKDSNGSLTLAEFQSRKKKAKGN